MLAAHGLIGAIETPLANDGYSGSALSRLVRDDGASFVLKRMSIDRDWIMRATDDVTCRETAFAAATIDLGDRVRTPNVGGAHDGGSYALLMRDISGDLLPHFITGDQLATIIARMAALHSRPLPSIDFPWCDAAARLTLLSPERARLAMSYGSPAGEAFLRGWEHFEALAPPPVFDTIHELWHDPAPLVRALASLPAALLHGDLKLDNIGLDPHGRMWLIDWAMPLIAAPAIELGWFIAINSRRIRSSPGEVLDMYAAAAPELTSGRERHDALTALCGLLLRGWRKALDADEGEPDELRWWCERAENAARLL